MSHTDGRPHSEDTVRRLRTVQWWGILDGDVGVGGCPIGDECVGRLKPMIMPFLRPAAIERPGTSHCVCKS